MVYLQHTIPFDSDSPRWVLALSNVMAFGVPIFFALSAYLITELLVIEKRTMGSVDIRAFYVRRILRIWPLYFLILGFGLVISRLVPNSAIPASGFIAYLLFVGNWYGCLSAAICHLWSITVEEQFYLVWPMLLRYATRRKLAVVCGLAWLCSQGTVIYLCQKHTNMELAFWTNSLVHLQYFALGAGLSLYFNGSVPQRTGRVRILMIASGWMLMFAIDFFLDPFSATDRTSLAHTFPEFLLIGAAIALLLVGFLGYSSLQNYPSLRYLGKISYGLYLYHLPCLWFLRKLLPHLLNHYSSLVSIAVGLPMTVGISVISYRYFESPFLRLKERFEVVKSRAV